MAVLCFGLGNHLRPLASRRLPVLPPLPPQRLRRRAIPPTLLRPLAHQGTSLPLPLRPAPPSGLPRPLRRQSETRIAAHPLRTRFHRLRQRRPRSRPPPRRV